MQLMGTKRDRAEMEGIERQMPLSHFMPMFEQFRTELDEHHDRRERVIKASRDITAASKKIIFTLQRVRALNKSLPQNVVKGNKQYHDTIAAQSAAVSQDLQGINAWRYSRQISGGSQEYIEAASFEYYLKTARLLTYDEAAQGMRSLDPDGHGVALSLEDYVLGIYDMTGELMRFAITAMATSGSLPSVSSANDASTDTDDTQGSSSDQRSLLTDMRLLRSELESVNAGIGPFAKEVNKKMEVMQASVEKVEKALYGLVVRGAERPKGWMPDTEPSRTVEVEGRTCCP